MSECPETLVEKVALALWTVDYPEGVSPFGTWEETHKANRGYYKSQAQTAIEALGLYQERSERLLRGGYRGPKERRFVTPWEEDV